MRCLWLMMRIHAGWNSRKGQVVMAIQRIGILAGGGDVPGINAVIKLSNLSTLGIEHLIVIGGDDTLSYATKLDELGVKIIAIPKTMDNDVRNTEYCIGFST